jgi:hypothetical protein
MLKRELIMVNRMMYWGILISIIILIILLSMLNMGAPDELRIARWAICGILTLVVVAAQVKLVQKHTSWAQVAVYSLVLPLLVIIIFGALMAAMDQDRFFNDVMLSPSFSSTFLIFLAPWLTGILFKTTGG